MVRGFEVVTGREECLGTLTTLRLLTGEGQGQRRTVVSGGGAGWPALDRDKPVSAAPGVGPSCHLAVWTPAPGKADHWLTRHLTDAPFLNKS